jgi:hypothetical protein
MAEEFRTETIKAEGSQLIDKIKKLVHEGNVRHIAIKQGERTVVEFPLTIGVVGVVIAPVLAAVGALAALLSDCTIEVERAVDAPVPFEQPAEAEPVGAAVASDGQAPEVEPELELTAP